MGGLGGKILGERVEVVAFGRHKDTRISDGALGSGQLQQRVLHDPKWNRGECHTLFPALMCDPQPAK